MTDHTAAHDDAVACVYWAEREFLLVSGSWDASIKVWQYGGHQAIRCLAQFHEHETSVTCVQMSSGRTMVASGDIDGSLIHLQA